jgi:hypothetical protein
MLLHQIISILVIFTLSFVLIIKLPFFRNMGLKVGWRLGLFVMKIVASLLILLLYTHYYPRDTADLYKYFSDGKRIYEESESVKQYLSIVSGIGANQADVKSFTDDINHWNRQYLKGVWNDNRTIIRLNAVFYPLTGGSLIAHSILFAFIGFLGLCFLYVGIRRFSGGGLLTAIAVFLIPGMFFWSSGMLKEAILTLNLGLLFYAVSKLYDRFTLKRFLLLLLAVCLFVLTKIYVLFCLVPAIVFLVFVKRVGNKWLFFGIVHLLIIISIIGVGKLNQDVNLLHVLDRKQHDFISMVEQSDDVGSDVQLNDVDANVFSVFALIPDALFNSFFRPLPSEWKSPVKLFAGLENLMLLTLLIYSLFKAKKLSSDEWNFLLFTMSFVLIYYSIIGISTPVVGALVRYKIPALPFLGAAILVLFKSNKTIGFFKYFTNE